jgi:hypothetical protein
MGEIYWKRRSSNFVQAFSRQGPRILNLGNAIAILKSCSNGIISVSRTYSQVLSNTFWQTFHNKLTYLRLTASIFTPKRLKSDV